MSDIRLWLALGLLAFGVGWVVVVGIYRGWSRDHSTRMFWLHLTAPVVCIVLELLALWVILTR
ncbi:MAG: hypothetical protein M3552_14860 [Planctomycetota bacterium]|nr:hypothetical protein [Planctomycetaceae bacterium]MDQ3331910.1 hypothetical protein [Planctomycetota bacterium]